MPFFLFLLGGDGSIYNLICSLEGILILYLFCLLLGVWRSPKHCDSRWKFRKGFMNNLRCVVVLKVY